jgi:hypothetical protein
MWKRAGGREAGRKYKGVVNVKLEFFALTDQALWPVFS